MMGVVLWLVSERKADLADPDGLQATQEFGQPQKLARMRPHAGTCPCRCCQRLADMP